MTKKYLVIMVLAAVAIVNAGYLSFEAYGYHFAGQPELSTACDAFGAGSCSDVLRDPLSLVFGIPFPFIALVVYPILFSIAWYGYRQSTPGSAKALVVLSGMGMGFNGFIIYREIFFIHQYCLLCLFCTLIIISIFGLSLAIIRSSETMDVPVK
jgi:uncharacterized membrane protein